MFVRLAFAVAINIDPEILIVDEALSVGDVFFQAKCYHKFEEFKEMGKTILFVTHDMGAINKYCQRAILLNKGEKVFEGSPKEAIDVYKKLLVEGNNVEEVTEEDFGKDDKMIDVSTKWKEALTVNPDLIKYGNDDVDIIDFAVFNEAGHIVTTLDNGENYTVAMKVLFKKDISEPIFAFTIKDLKGTEIAGTNTIFENISTGLVKSGGVRIARFTQKMNLQRGEYLISLGCTGYRDGEFVVYERLYDAFSISVLTQKNIVGYYDLESIATVN